MKVVLKSVRLSFPSLFTTEKFNGQDTGKYAASFLIEKTDPQAKALMEAINKVSQEAFKKDHTFLAPAKLCFKDGDTVDYKGYEGCLSIKANTKKRPTLLNRDKSPIHEDDDVIYAGCYVNASIDVYALDNQYGKRISCQLNGIQFVKDGDAFGSGGNAADDFDEMDEPSEEEASGSNIFG